MLPYGYETQRIRPAHECELQDGVALAAGGEAGRLSGHHRRHHRTWVRADGQPSAQCRVGGVYARVSAAENRPNLDGQADRLVAYYAAKGGLFRASDGRCLNADVNGAFNILRKGVPDACGNGRGGVVVHPARRTLANGPHGSHVHVA